MTWYYCVDGKNIIGPIPKEQLIDLINRGLLNSQTIVWQEGMPQWLSASTVNELFPKDSIPALPNNFPQIPPLPNNNNPIIPNMPHLPNYDYSPYNNPSGTRASVPKEIKGWNWGAFLICFFWSIGNNVWIGLLSATPFVGLFVAIYMGINGNELAWKNKRWESVEHFKSTQKNWTIAGVIFTIISFFLVILIAAAGG